MHASAFITGCENYFHQLCDSSGFVCPYFVSRLIVPSLSPFLVLYHTNQQLRTCAKKVRSIRNRKSGPLPFRGGACFPSGTFAPGSRVVFVPNPKLVSPDPSPRLQSPGTTSMRPIAIGNGSPISRGSRPPRPLSDSPEYEFGETLGNKTLCRRLRKSWEDEVPGN